MKKQSITTQQERKMKFAEGGILIALVVALALFVGTRLTGPDIDEVGATGSTAVAVTADSVEVSDPAQLALTETESQDAPVEIQSAAAEEETQVPEEVATVTYAMAESTYQEGRYAEAADLFIRYTREHDGNAWGFYMLGLSEWKAGSCEDAETAFQMALELKPDHLKSLVNYGRVLIEMNRSEEARVQIASALAVNPHSVDANRVMGRIQHNLGQLEEAEVSYRAVLSQNNEDVWALNNLGLILIEQEEFEAALAPLAKASLLRGDLACVLNNLGIALERTGQFQAAEEAYALALDADQDYTKASASLVRVEGLVQNPALIPVDLAALADGFGIEIQEADMEVASANETSAPVPDEPEMDGSRNR